MEKQDHFTSKQKFLKALSDNAYEINAEFQVNTGTAAEFGFKVRTGENQYTKIGYSKNSASLFVDRSQSGNVSFNPNFNTGKHAAPLQPVGGKVKMRIYVDRSSVEVFGNDGRQVITDIILPDRSSKGLEVYASNGFVKLNSMTVHPLKTYGERHPFNRI